MVHLDIKSLEKTGEVTCEVFPSLERNKYDLGVTDRTTDDLSPSSPT